MSRTLISMLCAISSNGTAIDAHPDSGLWRIDKDTVFYGGCVSITFDVPRRAAASISLGIGDHEPVIVHRGAGATFHHRGQTGVRLSHDLLRAELLQDDGGHATLIHIPPIFRRTETITLTIFLKGDAIGTKSIDVVPATDGMRAAIELLFPTVDRQKALREREDALRWLKLATIPSYGMTPRMTREQLKQLNDDLPIIMQHPDWAQIAEMLVARLEARAHYSELIVQEEGIRPTLNISGDVLPPWPGIVTRCLKSSPNSLFGDVIQNDIRGLVREIRMMDANRRGEDIWAILEHAAKEKQ